MKVAVPLATVAALAQMAPWVRRRVGTRMSRKLGQLEAACAVGSWSMAEPRA